MQRLTRSDEKLGLVGGAVALDEGLTPGPQDSAIAEALARQLPRVHLTQAALNDDVSRQAWKHYLVSLDRRHIFFLESDIAAFKQRQLTLDDALARGDVSFAYEVFNLFRQRVNEGHAYLGALLEGDLDLEADEAYRWNREDVAWPRDQNAWNEVWRHTVKDRYLRYAVGAPGGAPGDDGPEPGATPATAVAQRYDRFREVVNGRDAASVLEQYLTSFAKAYDPHCHYMSPASATRFDAEDEGTVRHELRQIRDTDGETRRVGLITLSAFYGRTPAQVDNAEEGRSSAGDVEAILQGMATNHVQGVLLDLRNNGGGSLHEAIRMTGLFIPSGPVVQVKSREGIVILTDNDGVRAYAGPLVLLVNRRTASASELLAGALQDYGCAIVVGDTKTHGKGSVQGVHDVGEDGRWGAIKTTDALYYRVSGGSTQLKGVTPDIVLPSRSDSMPIGEDFLENPLPWSMVRPARFRPLGDTYEMVPVLTALSLQRRSEDSRFADYTNFLARVDTLDKAEMLSLNIEQRKKMATVRNKLYDLGREFAAEAGEASGDIVLQEALNIVADLVSLHPGR
ncbi:MAG: carboxy terminal-processing peptidase [Verrucomicrobia bacterium]|jgi:C-terminal processing protease CtpA/Prc|nr:carboxy terminal-processing peptidase [Verrucomicrobiota bacterium]MBT7066146.1 carboxy terminal-processing peptidase [Verrucomicrobiota bacterium]MBT7699409.1 carboxy terminal-processing peptidase [Verrucomicrobiota bacterium]